jgi:hypothetical protein
MSQNIPNYYGGDAFDDGSGGGESEEQSGQHQQFDFTFPPLVAALNNNMQQQQPPLPPLPAYPSVNDSAGTTAAYFDTSNLPQPLAELIQSTAMSLEEQRKLFQELQSNSLSMAALAQLPQLSQVIGLQALQEIEQRNATVQRVIEEFRQKQAQLDDQFHQVKALLESQRASQTVHDLSNSKLAPGDVIAPCRARGMSKNHNAKVSIEFKRLLLWMNPQSCSQPSLSALPRWHHIDGLLYPS